MDQIIGITCASDQNIVFCYESMVFYYESTISYYELVVFLYVFMVFLIALFETDKQDDVFNAFLHHIVRKRQNNVFYVCCVCCVFCVILASYLPLVQLARFVAMGGL